MMIMFFYAIIGWKTVELSKNNGNTIMSNQINGCSFLYRYSFLAIGVKLYVIAKLFYEQMGDKENAKAKFMEALALLPEDHPDAIDIREWLEEL